VVEAAPTVAACLWVLAFAQGRLGRPGRPALARGAYAAFLVQGPVLVGLALGLHPIPVVGEVKALVLAVTGVAASFTITRPLVLRTPPGRIL